MKKFKLQSKYSPAGDQGKAIKEISNYLDKGYDWQTLWGVTGSGKTFTMANIIEKEQKPTLIIAHNKTLAAQLAQEFKEFFPDNAVHYFVSYYDYYQPEAYVSKTDTYIEKEATINEEIDRLRHAATQDLLTRKDVIIVASVSCIYGIGDISLYTEQIFDIEVGKEYEIEELLTRLVSIQYKRAGSDFKPGNFQVMGDLLEIFPSSKETVYSIEFWGNEVTRITSRNYLTGEIYEYLTAIKIFPAKHTVTTKDRINKIIPQIQSELDARLKYFKEDLGDALKYERLKTKVEYDIEMMQEVGYVNGIENYSSYLDGRKTGDCPATLMNYFGDDFMCFIDESHMTIPQIGAMYAGDRARKENLVENGFRLPSAMDNRPLKFEEFESKLKQVVAVSATPGKYEIGKSIKPYPQSSNPKSPLPNPPPKGEGAGKKDFLLPLPLGEDGGGGFDWTGKSIGDMFFDFDPIKDGDWKSSEDIRIVPQVIRPTGLLDPIILLKPMEYMVDDIMKSLSEVIDAGERMLITTITKRSSEELSDYLLENGIKVRYLHSEIETLERIDILKDLRTGVIDVIVGVNLLREGLDLPEVSKIGIIDADKQGFLRSTSALIQIIGRAARNSKGEVSMYVEKIINEERKKFIIDKGRECSEDGLVISQAMKKAIEITNYRRELQDNFNKKHNITPETVFSTIKEIGIKNKKRDYSVLDKESAEKELKKLEFEMDVAAANMEYEKAAEIRDMIIDIKKGKKK